jgi:hypothetical protein
LDLSQDFELGCGVWLGKERERLSPRSVGMQQPTQEPWCWVQVGDWVLDPGGDLFQKVQLKPKNISSHTSANACLIWPGSPGTLDKRGPNVREVP